MSKFALCIPRAQAAIDFTSTDVQLIPPGFFGADTTLVDRQSCETDPDLLQLIPYIVLRSPNGGIFCYERGTGGAENRLHAKLSVGLGGHVDDSPTGDLWDHLIAEGGRELLEEVGLRGELDPFTHLVYTGATGQPVDQVHLGLIAQCYMRQGDTIDPEKGVVERGHFMSLVELLSPETYDRLEPWSQAVVTELSHDMSRRVGSAMGVFGSLISGFNIQSPTGLTSAATQEAGAVLCALGRNLQDTSAFARIYDADEVENALSDLLMTLREVRDFVRTPPPL